MLAADSSGSAAGSSSGGVLPPPEWGLGVRKPLLFDHLLNAFDERVAASGNSPAVVCGDEVLTYAALDRRANRLAHVLVARGVEVGDIVPVFLPRGIDFIVAVLAVIKAGGGYMPLDLRSPLARNEAILRRAGVKLVVTSQALREGVPDCAGTVPVDGADVANARVDPVDRPRDSRGLVYVINTSGSTGEPKSAAVSHRSFANLIGWYIDRLGLHEEDRVLIVSATTFDASQKNLFTPLIVGGMLVLPEDDGFDPEGFAALIDKHQISWINGTPSNVYPIIEGPGAREPRLLASLRWVVLGGEPINPRRLLPWLKDELCSARVLNTYGPTECTDICASYAFNRYHGSAPVPLGGPIDNVRLAVVDENGQKVRPGGTGELWIGGVGVGLGYVGRPDLNEIAFAESNIFGTPRRVYRTGDRVRLRTDGFIEFVGRMDQQVKLHGFRLELGEIEAALESLDGVGAATAVLREDLGAEPLLVAFLSSDGTPRPSDAALEAGLGARIPDYAVPSRFLWLDTLPLSPNGKVDRKALAAVHINAAGEGAGAVAWHSASTLELTIATHWAGILGHRRFSLDDTFFDTGGSSLGLAQLQAALGKELGRVVPIVAMFAHPTVRRLASSLQAETTADDMRTRPLPLRPESDVDAVRVARMQSVRRAR